MDLLVQEASERPGLIVLHVHEAGTPSSRHFWQSVIEVHSDTMQDLSYNAWTGEVDTTILAATFSRLKTFQLLAHEFQELHALDTFLDRHQDIEILSLDTRRTHAQPDSFRQTFPKLRSMYLMPPFPSQDFAERHQHLLSSVKPVPGDLHQTQTTAEFGSSSEYRNQRYALVFASGPLQDMVNAKLPLSHVLIGSRGSEAEPIEDYIKLLRPPSATAHSITCLEIDTDCYDLRDVMRAFDPALFPNLVEVGIVTHKKTTAAYSPDEVEGCIKNAIAFFYSAEQLRILRICEGHARCPDRDILLNHEFPPALEYFGWLDPPMRVTQYFRFVPHFLAVDENRHGSKLPSSSGHGRKVGRVQRVSSVFRTQIGRDGVWARAYDDNFDGTVLDHLSGVPTLW
ncbi:hypothetical protein V8E36_005285 [Tilletia maclaganii]